MDVSEKNHEIVEISNSGLQNEGDDQPALDSALGALAQMLGLPDRGQLDVMDQSLNEIDSMVSMFQERLDKVQKLINTAPCEDDVKKIETKILEIRSIMKKFFPNAMETEQNISPVGVAEASSSRLMSNRRPDVLD